ncbi:MAG: PAS domain S-box protein, partial [Gammaproteobacteria bacterium]|nr:PAS domain S-box protein [Gammaproteobacteria bacterium]
MPSAFTGSTSDARALDTPLSDAFEHFPDALVLTDGEARLSYLNPAAEQLLGLSLKNARGHRLDKVLTLQDGTTRQSIPIGDLAGQHTPFTGSFHLLVRNGGGAIPVQCSIALNPTGSGTTGGFMIVLRNASGLQQYIDRLVTQSMHDEHSRLLRRAELVKRLWRLLQETDEGEPQAFMYLDLDNF